jgi:hypothetical protein
MVPVEPHPEAVPRDQHATTAAIIRKDVNLLTTFFAFDQVPKMSRAKAGPVGGLRDIPTSAFRP